MSYKGYRLPGDLVLLAWVGALLIYYSLLVRLQPMPTILNRIRLKQGSGPVTTTPDVAQLDIMDKIYRAATFGMTRIGRSSRPCLRRSLILYHWCSQKGLAARVVIGVKKAGENLQGHSWLLLDEQPYHEPPDYVAPYTVILEG